MTLVIPFFHVWRDIYIVLRIKCVLFTGSFKAYRFEQENEQEQQHRRANRRDQEQYRPVAFVAVAEKADQPSVP